MLRWMEYKEGGIDILLQSGKLSKWFKEFIVVNSQSLRFSLLFSKVESVDFMASWCHQQGGKDKVLKSTLNSLITSDLCFALAVVGSFLDCGFWGTHHWRLWRWPVASGLEVPHEQASACPLTLSAPLHSCPQSRRNFWDACRPHQAMGGKEQDLRLNCPPEPHQSCCTTALCPVGGGGVRCRSRDWQPPCRMGGEALHVFDFR